MKTPPVTYFIKQAANIKSGSQRPGHAVAAEISVKNIFDIAQQKQQDVPDMSIDAICRSVAGTCKSMGVKVVSAWTALPAASQQIILPFWLIAHRCLFGKSWRQKLPAVSRFFPMDSSVWPTHKVLHRPPTLQYASSLLSPWRQASRLSVLTSMTSKQVLLGSSRYVDNHYASCVYWQSTHAQLQLLCMQCGVWYLADMQVLHIL